MRFLFVDRVIELERDRRIVAVRQISLAEEIFAQHFPGRPMMPASLLIEAMAQAATILLEASSYFRLKAFLGYISNAKFRHPIVPGHEIRLDLAAETVSEDGAVLSAVVYQQERRCATAQLGMVVAPLIDFFRPEHMPHYLTLYDTWLDGTSLKGFDVHPLERRRRDEI